MNNPICFRAKVPPCFAAGADVVTLLLLPRCKRETAPMPLVGAGRGVAMAAVSSAADQRIARSHSSVAELPSGGVAAT